MLEEIINGGKLFGVLIGIIKSLIEALEVPGHGAEKKKAVKDVIQEIWEAVDKEYNFPLPDWKYIKSVVGTTIDLIVKVWNLTGKLSTQTKEE